MKGIRVALVAVGVFLAIWAGLVLFASQPQTASPDAIRLSDLRQVQDALEIYYRKCGYYPGGTISGGACPGVFTGAGNWSAMVTSLQSLSGIGGIPNDPSSGKTYYYSVNNVGSSYLIAATLENVNNSVFNNYTPPSTAGYTGSVSSCAPPVYCVML